MNGNVFAALHVCQDLLDSIKELAAVCWHGAVWNGYVAKHDSFPFAMMFFITQPKLICFLVGETWK